MDKKVTPKLRVIGTPTDIEKLETYLKPYNQFEGYQEAHIRHILQELIDNPVNRLRQLTVLYDGNTVWSKHKIISDMKKIVKNHDMSQMTNHLYEFLSLCCGSIAHYNKLGWIATYPTVSHLRGFFSENEMGEKVINYIPHWKTDVISIVKDINKLLGVK